jgi:hypothetical protein
VSRVLPARGHDGIDTGVFDAGDGAQEHSQSHDDAGHGDHPDPHAKTRLVEGKAGEEGADGGPGTGGGMVDDQADDEGEAMEQAISIPINGRIWVRSTRMASCTASLADPSLTMAEN